MNVYKYSIVNTQRKNLNNQTKHKNTFSGIQQSPTVC